MSARAVTGGADEARSTRDLILDAAERRFAEHGFAAVSVREIAADAGLKNQASLYHHFRNKRALYEAVLARGLAPLIAVVTESGSAGRANTDTFLDRMVDHLATNPHLPRLIQRAGLDDSKALRSALTRLLRPFYAEGLSVLAATGAPWSGEQLPHLAAGLYHMIFGYFANATLLESVFPSDPRSPAAIERQRHFLKTALALLLGAPPLGGRGSARARGGARRA
jgi:AcrR family transcriptional regulator